MTKDSYAYWHSALDGQFGSVHDGDAQVGFYRRRAHRDGPWLPVAIFHHEGELVALVDNQPADPGAIWIWVCDKPITEAAYHKAVAGDGWGDEPPVAVLPSNMPTDPMEALKVEFAAEQEIAAELLSKPVGSKDQANQIAVLTKRLTGIKGRATDLHKTEKQPHLDAGRSVDEKWRDLKDSPDDLSKKLKRHLQAWLDEQDRIERDRQAKAREEAARKQREADEARIAAERAEAKIIADGMADAAAIAEHNNRLAEADRKAEAAVAAARDAEARNASAGRTGAKVSLRTFPVAEITDFDALLAALKDRPEIRELVATLAQRAAKAGVELPGMKIKEERRAA